MKDEKFCFKKSTGFIALVGILLVGFVLFAQMSNTSTSTDTKAGPKPKECYYAELPLTTSSTPYRYNSSTYCIESIDATGVATNVGYKCNQLGGTLTGGSERNQKACPLPVAAAQCLYGGEVVGAASGTYTMDASTKCVQVAGVNNGYMCRVDAAGSLVAGRNSAVKSASCAAPTGVPRTTCYWGQQNVSGAPVKIGTDYFALDLECIITGKDIAQMYNNGFKCGASTGYRTVRDLKLCPLYTTNQCLYGGEVVGAASGTYTMDASTNCVQVAGVNNGYMCRVDAAGSLVAGRNSAVKSASCAAPTGVPSTTCYWGQQTLSGTPVKIGTDYFALDLECIITGKVNDIAQMYNNGYKCGASTGYKSVSNTDACPL